MRRAYLPSGSTYPSLARSHGTMIFLGAVAIVVFASCQEFPVVLHDLVSRRVCNRLAHASIPVRRPSPRPVKRHAPLAPPVLVAPVGLPAAAHKPQPVAPHGRLEVGDVPPPLLCSGFLARR